MSRFPAGFMRRVRVLTLVLTSILPLAWGVPAFAIDARVAHGRALVETTNCAACHGADMNSPIVAHYPKLAGQHPDYTYFALRQYQMGNGNPMLGRDNEIMRAQIQGMSEADLRAIAAYLAWLPGDLVDKK